MSGSRASSGSSEIGRLHAGGGGAAEDRRCCRSASNACRSLASSTATSFQPHGRLLLPEPLSWGAMTLPFVTATSIVEPPPTPVLHQLLPSGYWARKHWPDPH